VPNRKIKEIQNAEAEAKDNLLQAKVTQAHFANQHQGKDDIFVVGDLVMLSTLHHRQQYKKKNEKRVAKFFPRFDGPYTIIRAHPEFSTYTLDMPNSPLTFPTFHASQLKRFVSNNVDLFPSREHSRPKPIVTTDGVEEYSIEEIIDARRRGHGWSFLV
jgi:hypothetical protein